MKQFYFENNVTALAAGQINTSFSNAPDINPYFDLKIKTFSAWAVRRSAGSVIQSRASIEVFLFSNPSTQLDKRLISTGSTLTNTIRFICTPECPQMFLDGLAVPNSTNLILGMTIFDFGTTVLNDIVNSYYLLGYE